jgi:hypothetical protein
VLRNQLLCDGKEHFSPNFSDGVDAPVPRLVKSLIGFRIDLVVQGILRKKHQGVSNALKNLECVLVPHLVFSDPTFDPTCPFAHGEIDRFRLVHSDQSREEIAPT